MTRTIAIFNCAGGSAKTTTAVNLAAGLAELGRRVLLVDLDSSAASTGWNGIADADASLLDVYTGARTLGSLVRPGATPGVEVTAARPWPLGADKVLACMPDADQVLRRQLARLPAGRWDYVLIDCPPQLEGLAASALVAAPEVLAPVLARELSVAGLRQLLDVVAAVRRGRINPGLVVSGIVVCRVAGRERRARQVITGLRRDYGRLVRETVIRESVRLGECPSFRRPITTYAPDTSGATDYRALAREVVGHEGQRSGAPW